MRVVEPGMQADIIGPAEDCTKIILFSRCKLRYFGLHYICDRNKEFTLLENEEVFPDDTALLASSQPDLLIVDQALLIGSSAYPGDVLRKLRQIARILLIADQVDFTIVCEAVACGIDGYLLTSASQDEMLQALRAIARGASWLEMRFVKMLIERLTGSVEEQRAGDAPLWGSHPLSEREQQILRYLAQGYTCKEIARELYLSESSVRTYWYRTMNKLNAVNKAEAILIASHAGLLDNLTPEHEIAGRRKK